MFGLKWLRSDPKTLKCNLNEIGLMTENNLESLRREKVYYFPFHGFERLGSAFMCLW